MIHKRQTQEYDNSLKALFGDEAPDILSYLLPGTELVGEENIEIDRSKLKADLVYNIKYEGRPHILNMELQTHVDRKIHLRMLQYHVGLLAKYEIPVISVVLYPFETNVPRSPFEEKSGDKVLLTWHYEVIILCQLEAEQFVSQGAICMYSMLPAMKGADEQLLLQAIKGMEEYYSREELRHHLMRFWRILQKTKTVAREDKELVEEKLRMHYDWFIDTNPEVIQRVSRGKAEGKAEGKIEGKIEGKVEGLRQSVMIIVKSRFPALEQLAWQQVTAISNAEHLNTLIGQLIVAPNEEHARKLLYACKA
jgi:predicted transposase YdaD